MTLSGDNITAIIIAGITTGIGAVQAIVLAVILRRTRRIRDKVDVVDTKVSGVAAAVSTVHALVDSRHSELQGELKKANEFTDAALKLAINRDGVPPRNPNSRDD